MSCINVGMVEGLLPIVGIPLPFVSAGGSSLISFFIGHEPVHGDPNAALRELEGFPVPS